VLAGHLRQYTQHTTTSPARLCRNLRTIRATGIAVSDRELEAGSSAVAMPVFGRRGQIAAAIEVSIPDLAQHVPAVRASLAMAAGAFGRELSQKNLVGSYPAADQHPVDRGRRISRNVGPARLLQLTGATAPGRLP
jgi:hypothetical protein